MAVYMGAEGQALLATFRLPVNVLAVMALVENMPSGKSLKLGDVLRARNGKTIEVLNTDAEGRLLLADALSYAAEQNVAHLVDPAACLFNAEQLGSPVGSAQAAVLFSWLDPTRPKRDHP